MKTNKERLKLISRIYKIAAVEDECVVEGLQFIEDNYNEVSDLYNKKSSSALNNKQLKDISDKILNKNYFSNEESEEEYKQYLTSICLKGLEYYKTSSNRANLLFENDLKAVLEKTDAPFFENYKYLIEFAKIILKTPETTAKNIIENYDKKLSGNTLCWDYIIDEELLEKLEGGFKKERKDKKQRATETAGAEALRRQVRDEGEAKRLQEKQEADKRIAEIERIERESAEAEKKEKEEIQKFLEEDLSQEQLYRDLGITPSDIEDADDPKVQGILDSMFQRAEDPKDKMKIRDFQQKSLRTSVPKFYDESPQSSGFFSSAIRRKMRLLKK